MTPHTPNANGDGQTAADGQAHNHNHNHNHDAVSDAERARESDSYRDALYYCDQESYEKRAHLYVLTDRELLGDGPTLDSACRLSTMTDVTVGDDRFKPYHEIADVEPDDQYPGSTQLCLHCRSIWEHIDRPISELIRGKEIEMSRRHYVIRARTTVTEQRREQQDGPATLSGRPNTAATGGRF